MVADYSKDLAEDGSLTMLSSETKHTRVYQLVAVNRAGRVEKEVKLCACEKGRRALFMCGEGYSPIPMENLDTM